MTNRIAQYLDQPETEAPAEQCYVLSSIREDSDGGETFTVLARFRSQLAAELHAATLAKRLARDAGNRVRVVEVRGDDGKLTWRKWIPRPQVRNEPVRLTRDMVAVVAWSLVLAVAAVVVGMLVTR